MADSGDRPARPSDPESPARLDDGHRAMTGPPSTRASGDAGQDAGLPLDVVFDLLKNRRRRLVLGYLVDGSEPCSLSDLAEYIAAVENEKTIEEISTSERKRVYVGLYQGHLPRLDDADVVHFDDDRGTVTIGENASQLLSYLNGDGDSPQIRASQYLAIAMVGGVAYLGQQLLYPNQLLSAIIMGLFLGFFAYLSIEYAYREGVPGWSWVGWDSERGETS